LPHPTAQAQVPLLRHVLTTAHRLFNVYYSARLHGPYRMAAINDHPAGRIHMPQKKSAKHLLSAMLKRCRIALIHVRTLQQKITHNKTHRLLHCNITLLLSSAWRQSPQQPEEKRS
jgi:hypothetical protein